MVNNLFLSSVPLLHSTLIISDHIVAEKTIEVAEKTHIKPNIKPSNFNSTSKLEGCWDRLDFQGSNFILFFKTTSLSVHEQLTVTLSPHGQVVNYRNTE